VSLAYIDTCEKATAVVLQVNAAADADGVPPVVSSTFVDAECREVLASARAVVIDFFDAFTGPLESALSVQSSHTMGRAHGIGDITDYSVRMDAVSYALNLDDGAPSSRLGQAEQLFRRAGIAFVGTPHIPVEEIARTLIHHYGLQRGLIR